MFRNETRLSTVHAVLPNSTARRVLETLTTRRSALVWQARGTLLRDDWTKRWLPPISPLKTESEKS